MGFSDLIHHLWRHPGVHPIEHQGLALTHLRTRPHFLFRFHPGSFHHCLTCVLTTQLCDSVHSGLFFQGRMSISPWCCWNVLILGRPQLSAWFFLSWQWWWKPAAIYLSRSPWGILGGGHLFTIIHDALQCLNTQGPNVPFEALWVWLSSSSTMQLKRYYIESGLWTCGPHLSRLCAIKPYHTDMGGWNTQDCWEGHILLQALCICMFVRMYVHVGVYICEYECMYMSRFLCVFVCFLLYFVYL